MTSDRRHRSPANQPELPLQPRQAWGSSEPAGTEPTQTELVGTEPVRAKPVRAKPVRTEPNTDRRLQAPARAAGWRLDERTRRIGRQGVAAARAQLEGAGLAGQQNPSDDDHRPAGRAA